MGRNQARRYAHMRAKKNSPVESKAEWSGIKYVATRDMYLVQTWTPKGKRHHGHFNTLKEAATELKRRTGKVELTGNGKINGPGVYWFAKESKWIVVANGSSSLGVYTDIDEAAETYSEFHDPGAFYEDQS